MKIPLNVPIPALMALRKLGSDINDTRRRRRITIKLLAERSTLIKIERGDPTVSIGRYASLLLVLGMIDRLSDLIDSSHDLIGPRFEDEKLPKRV